MKTPLFFLKFTAILLLLLLSRGMAQPVEAAIFVDQLGREVSLAHPPQRIVSLMPSITEIVFDLGAGDRIKGVTQFSNEPPPAAKLPKVGSYVHLDLEKIVSLRPDLCLAARDGNPKHMVDGIIALGIPVYSLDPRSLEEIMESILLLGDLLAKEKRAAAIVGEMKEKIRAAALLAARDGRTPRVFFQIDAAPIISAGSNTFIDQLISLAGGINLAAGSVVYPRYSWEDILIMRPEVVIIASMAGGYSDDELKAAWRRWPQLPAVRDNRLYVLKADMFDRPTARIADGLQMLVDILHPRLPPDQTETRN
ncbi:MAG: hypothetical protein BM485_02450 [Desulfobulbaceae bacterium DB1]|nr:MAG: hypothetical protein BM485_02450 [Desulfobulbaceae bacterium DB1]